MPLLKKLNINEKDSKEIVEIKKTINFIVDFIVNKPPIKQRTPHYFIRHKKPEKLGNKGRKLRSKLLGKLKEQKMEGIK